ncbi:MAG: septal ring lytic transglycosylase RlpA family protein [Spongiibacteraceae bacterium]|jgi:rare lipoprotein A|nr:septal ring lytic transglycosylase RlpA family protein [Spongiibacteraceae bacterium]
MRRWIARAAAPLGALLLAILLSACGTTPTGDGTPSRRLDPDRIPDAVPRHEPIRAAGNKSPYTVLGKTYRVLPTAKGYRARGIASWYGTKFHGRPTSNGERYDVYGMTAAHTSLPIPTYVRVTNLENGRQAIVRVNDRGPFVHDRLIDLSYAAATKLGFAHKGTARVEVEAIDVDNWPPRKAYAQRSAAPSSDLSTQPHTSSSASTPNMRPAGVGGHYVQVGAFGSISAAEAMRRQLTEATGFAVQIEATSSKPVLYRVKVGPVADQQAAEQLRAQLLAGYVSEARVVR